VIDGIALADEMEAVKCILPIPFEDFCSALNLYIETS